MEGDKTPRLTMEKLRFARALRNLESTDALVLQVELLAWTCPVCGKHRPRVYCTTGRIRYVQCRGCETTGKVST